MRTPAAPAQPAPRLLQIRAQRERPRLHRTTRFLALPAAPAQPTASHRPRVQLLRYRMTLQPATSEITPPAPAIRPARAAPAIRLVRAFRDRLLLLLGTAIRVQPPSIARTRLLRRHRVRHPPATPAPQPPTLTQAKALQPQAVRLCRARLPIRRPRQPAALLRIKVLPATPIRMPRAESCLRPLRLCHCSVSWASALC